VSETREQYVQGDLFQVGDRVVVIADDTIATVTHLGSNYVIVEQEGLQMRKWLNAVELLEKRQPQDPDVSKVKGTQPKPYYKGLDKDTKQARAAHFRAYANKSPAEKDAAPYKKAPGDATAKTKPSKYTLKFKQMYGENSAVDLAKKRIDQEKAADAKRHDRMMDKARLKDTQATNKATK